MAGLLVGGRRIEREFCFKCRGGNGIGEARVWFRIMLNE